MAFHLNPHSTIIFSLFFQKFSRLSIDGWLAASIGKPHGAQADFPAAPKRRPPAQTPPAAGVFHP
ncbi:hypothetical protein DI43_06735 [Geobacillus sp. CAMR12739]|uniref:hypothetical protein n=1 Tax=Geobacillus sp. (strain C56-T3) TaxID=691437 RepID=UPI00031A3587|nr:hypothetical protein [Geobacillus sp. C56-T3]KDE48047.1 hypothetical protein DI43_06735 [Geobacillus sp. CAMR12739]